MTQDPFDVDDVEFDPQIAVALAEAVTGPVPRPEVKRLLLERVEAHEDHGDRRGHTGQREHAVPAGFSFRFGTDDRWLPHPVRGIRMKVLALNRQAGYATLLFDVAPGTRFPVHYHHGAEECYVISGSLYTCGRKMVAGDFLHADAGTDHGELWTEEGCRVLLVVPPEDELPEP